MHVYEDVYWNIKDITKMQDWQRNSEMCGPTNLSLICGFQQ
jgi:hypothetical protein